MMTNINLLIVQEHAVDGLNSAVGSFRCLVVNKAVSLRATLLISGDFARQNISKRGKGIMKGLEGR
jgi:hypothetical protein